MAVRVLIFTVHGVGQAWKHKHYRVRTGASARRSVHARDSFVQKRTNTTVFPGHESFVRNEESYQ